MKKILSRIFSVALIAATAASPSLAQTAKKAKAASTPQAKATVTMKAQAGPQKSAAKNAKADLDRTRKAGVKGIRQAKTFAKTPKGNRSIMRAEGEYPTIYGALLYSGEWEASGQQAVGVYTVPTAAGQSFEQQFALESAPNYGAALLDGVYYFNNYTNYGFFALCGSYGVDVETGETVYSASTDINLLAPGGMDVDPLTGKIYGIFFNDDASAYELASISYESATPVKTVVANVAGDWVAFAIDGAGQFYGISANTMEGASQEEMEGKLYKIDRNTGATELVGATGQYPNYIAGACMDKKTNRMFWTLSPADETGYITEVNLTTGAASVVYMFPGNEEVAGLYIPAPAAEEGAPAECENVSVSFTDDALAGTVTLKTPATNFDGSAGTGNLTVTVLANGEEAGTETAGYGQDVTVNVDLTAKGAGLYDFTVYASNAAGDGPKTTIKKVWVGADTPEATTATLTYANGNMEVAWLPVEGSVNGGYLDLANLTYTVKRGDGTVAVQGLTTTTFTEPVAEPGEITSYYYVVEANCGGLVSAPAQTNTVVLGAIIPPYECDFDDADLNGWTIIDANGDGKTWVTNQGAVRVSYNSSNEMDDWLITPPIKLEAGKAYNVAFQARSNSSTYAERIEVKFGKANTAEGMTNELIAPTDLTTGEWEDFEKMLVADEDGTYYVGFHGISDADMFYLWLDNVRIEAGVSALAPGMASNLKATADAAGANKCTVSFNAPDKTMNGQTLSSLTKVELLRGETVIKTFDAPATGAALSYEDTEAPSGDVTYTVVGYNAEGAGLRASVSTFVGFGLPAGVESATIARTAVEGQALVTWTPVTTDVNGLSLPAGKVTYTIVKANGNNLVEVASGLTGDSYTYQAVAAGEQDFIQVGVMAVTSEGSGDIAATDMIPVGTPYNGISESFSGGQLGEYVWGLRGINGGTVQLATDESGIPSQDGDNGFIGIKGSGVDSGADFFSGLVSLEGLENPGLVFYTFNIADPESGAIDSNEISVSVKEAGAEEWTEVMAPKTVNEICGGEQDVWGRVSVSLAAYANKVIQFQITGVSRLIPGTDSYYPYTMIDNIKVGSILANDLAATGITAPENVKAGASYKVDVKVANEGAQAAEGFSVELYADEELVETKAVESLGVGQSTTVSFDRTMSALATEPVSYYAKVVYAADENAGNNQTSSIQVVPVVSKLPAVADLSATNVEEGIKLTWSEPNIEAGVAEQITQDFEDGDAFAAEYGSWTFVDVDGSAVGGFQGTVMPGITPGTTTGSFWIWDTNVVATGNPTFEAHSGTKYLFALFRYDDGQSDDWAISPELTGDAQTISFYAKSYSAQYPEKISIYYSTGGKETSDFVMIDGSTVNAVPQDWTEYTAELPAGAKYFAIRSYASGSFMLMVDDVTFTPAPENANLEIAGYNVYRDGVKINEAPVADCEYVDTNVVEGTQYTYVVTVVYTDKGESKASNEVVIKRDIVSVNGIGDGSVSIKAANGKIVVLNAEGLDVVVAAANGAVVHSGAGELRTEVAVANGVYVVTAGRTVRKVIVR